MIGNLLFVVMASPVRSLLILPLTGLLTHLLIPLLDKMMVADLGLQFLHMTLFLDLLGVLGMWCYTLMRSLACKLFVLFCAPPRGVLMPPMLPPVTLLTSLTRVWLLKVLHSLKNSRIWKGYTPQSG